MDSVYNILELELVHIGNYTIKVFSLVAIVVIFLLTKLTLWLIKKALFRKRKKELVDEGNALALFQLIRYLIWVVSIGIILHVIGLKLTVLIAGSAALLVGVGLGLQQTFNDVISGIILLSERSIKVGDILEIDSDIVKIQSIGLRTSKGLNRDEISIIIPNSLITTNKVINWSHQSKHTRFKINIGVAYGSDVDLVIKVLKESALEHNEISDKRMVDVRFLDFGDSSLDFQLLFYSTNIFRIEKVKSEIRRIISKKLMENRITIPFPQLDLHLKSKITGD
ncbi:MAG: mechanosensitive ion channel [Bacteroidetes bacterium]|jgi:small-conductance mechanosensitive channel|nr:mechanosensitive ion channel [Bacteroidota bacterium]MBT3801761.1 mechanosensitive ion channel [Bacteroidota bacterium]MBT3933346.1 mechanosensitive ion channel [Bacteroidota bacterium]MBT5991121.1 mechanosensitive ion channel [Bacteroidota bacterium]MBT7995532.1 mechanosensitive ion channel [Bacteroidota bacterium]